WSSDVCSSDLQKCRSVITNDGIRAGIGNRIGDGGYIQVICCRTFTNSCSYGKPCISCWQGGGIFLVNIVKKFFRPPGKIQSITRWVESNRICQADGSIRSGVQYYLVGYTYQNGIGIRTAEIGKGYIIQGSGLRVH